MRHSRRILNGKIKENIDSHYDTIAADLIDSSGISDSSDDEENLKEEAEFFGDDDVLKSDDDEETLYERKNKNANENKSVTFADNEKNYGESKTLLQSSTDEYEEMYV